MQPAKASATSINNVVVGFIKDGYQDGLRDYQYTNPKALRSYDFLNPPLSARWLPVAGRLQGKASAASGALQGPMTLKLVHSTRPEKDIVLPLVADADGNFSVRLPLLEMARWQVMLEDGGRNWRVNGVWPWPQQAAVALSASQP